MNSKIQKPGTPWPLIVLFFVLSAIAIVLGVSYYRILEKNLLHQTVEQLSAIADLKVRQIIQWREERMSDGVYMSGNTTQVRQFSRFLKERNNKLLRDDLLGSLKSYVENYDYKNALFIDKNINVKLFYPNQDTIIGDHLQGLLPGVIRKGEVVLTDIHRTSKVSFIHLDLLVPLKGPDVNDSTVFGAVILRIDPGKVLFPGLQSWPISSKTAEALLVQAEGDEVVYLNKPKYVVDGEMVLRKPINEDKLPAAMAVHGIMETTDAIDYRGTPVIAAMKKVPEASWYLIAKIDREEVYASLSNRAGQVIMIVILFILTVGSFLGFLWWIQRSKFYKERYEGELERMALVKHYDYILRDSENKFRKIFEESPFSMIMTGKDMGILKANSAFCSMLGYNEEDVIGMTFRNFTHPDHISNDDVSLLRLIKKDIPVYHTEKRYIRRDGSVIWGSTTVTLIRNKNGEFQFSLATIEDITARRTARAELDKSFSLLKATLESTADGILVVDTEGRIVQYNRKFAEMWHIPDEILKLNNDEAALNFVLSQLKDPNAFIAKVKQLYADPEAVTQDLIEFKDGKTFFDRYSQPQKIGGKALGRVWSFRDITERKKDEAELIAAKEKAEEGDRLKTAFLHNVSHEIRTPMNAILGFSSLLNEQGLTEADRKQFVDVIFQSSNHLLSIINDIVDVASIESGQVKINIKEINVNSELRKLSEQFGYKQKPSKITLSLKTPLPDKDAKIMTDATKLIQILSNLINNAFKFTKEGKISFGYALNDDFLEFFVKDTGMGIAKEHQAKVFDRFYQVDSAVSRQYTGTGLGLSICKAYVELLGGRIWLNSAPGEGSLFSFTIRYSRKRSTLPPGKTY
jgi:PAS domain S-box-containing protein